MGKALILIDIQNDYFQNGAMTLHGSEAAAEKARMLLDIFREQELPVIHIQHLATRPDATFFLPGTAGAEINQRVSPTGNENVIIKHFPNSFRDTELLSFLSQENINELVVCGMMTHMCVDATVRAAKDHGFSVTLIGDACATKDLEVNGEKVKAQDVHNSFLAALNYFYSEVKTAEKYIESITK